MTETLVNVGRSIADAGFTVGLADLFDGRTAETEANARRVQQAGRSEPACKTLVRSLGELRKEAGTIAQGIGLVSFSIGGHWAVWPSQRPKLNITATVLYDAARGGDFSAARSSYLSHFADQDPGVSASARRGKEKAFAKAGRPYQAFDYPGTTYWIAETERSDAYEPKSADLALARTKAHLAARLMSNA